MVMYCDGSGTNGKHVGFCVVRVGEPPYIEIAEGTLTSNEMEYTAMIRALATCGDGETIFSDSMLIVKQLTKGWRIHAMNLKPLHDSAAALLAEKHADIRWLSRDNNIAGVVLDKAMAKHKEASI